MQPFVILLNKISLRFLNLVFQLPSSVWHFMTPWTAGLQAFLSLTISWSLPNFMSTESGRPSNHLILCCPLLLLPWIFPQPRGLFQWARWPKYYSFSFSPSNEYPVLISFQTFLFDLFAVQGTLRNLLQHHSLKASILWCSAFFKVQLSHPYMTTGKTWLYSLYITYIKVLLVSSFSLSYGIPVNDTQQPVWYSTCWWKFRLFLALCYSA